MEFAVLLSFSVLFAISSGEEQCQSLLLTVDQDPSCDPLGDCAGLQCYSEQLEQNTTVIVDKCTDPIVVNVTVTNATDGTVMLSQSFTETADTGEILVTKSRNATHAHIQVTTSDGMVQLIPYTEVPINAMACQCKALMHIHDNVESPVPTDCTINSVCSGLDCVFQASGLPFELESDIDACTNPPGVLIIVRLSGMVYFSKYFNESGSTSFVLSSLNVEIEHRPYSMILRGVMTTIPGGQMYETIPRTQIILDKSDCIQPTIEPPAGTEPPPVPGEACGIILQLPNNTNEGLGTCEAPIARCDSLVCHVLQYTGMLQVMPCVHPHGAGLHITIQNPEGDIIYDNVVNHSAQTSILLSSGIFLVLNSNMTQDLKIAGAVIVRTDFGDVEILSYFEIPLNESSCQDMPSISMMTSRDTIPNSMVSSSITTALADTSTGRVIPVPTRSKMIPVTPGSIRVPEVTSKTRIPGTTKISSITPDPLPRATLLPSRQSGNDIVVAVTVVVIAIILLVVAASIIIAVVLVIQSRRRHRSSLFEPTPFKELKEYETL